MAPTQLFINLPVSNLAASQKFYLALGFEQNTIFSDASTVCIVISDIIRVMLHEHNRFKTWVPSGKSIADAHKTTEALLCFTADSKQEVDNYVEKAAEAGGRADPSNIQSEGGMYGRSFEDPDGHVWELAYMQADNCPPAEEQA